MRKIFKKKIYNGMVELREHERDRFVRDETPVRIVVEDYYMDISVAELKKGIYINTQTSRFGTKPYRMLGWRWKPTPYRDPQVSLFPDASKLKKALERNGVNLK